MKVYLVNFKTFPLKDYVEIIMGQSPPSATYNINGIGLPFFQGKADFSDIYPTPRVYCTHPKKIAEKNDILISVRAPVGSVNVTSEKSAIGRGITAIRSTKIYYKYLFYYFRFIESQWENMSRGSTFRSIKKDDLNQIEIPIPIKNNQSDIEEQQRIAHKINKLFIEIDEGVNNTKKSIIKTKQLLPSELTKIFMQNNWQKVDLGDKNLFHIETGSTPSTKKAEYWNDGDIIWVTPKDLGKLNNSIVRDSERKITHQGLESCSTTLVPKGSIVISTRAPIGYVAIAGKELCFNQGCKAIVFHSNDLIPEYVYYTVLASVKKMQELGKGSTFTEISKGKLESIKIAIPFKDGKPDVYVQRKIAGKLESLKKESFNLGNICCQQLNNFNLMRQSVLNSAFTGIL